MKDKIVIECNAAEVSDGHHTFGELYIHRHLLFIAVMQSNPKISWRANNHDDGTMYPDWFIAGMHLPADDISYHLPVSMWYLLDKKGIITTNKGPSWDGHTSCNVLQRLERWIIENQKK